MIVELKGIDKEQLLTEVLEMCAEKYRFVTATCLDLGEVFQVIYTFDRDGQLRNLELKVDKNEEIPSLSSVYLCMFLIENEMKELFGLNITGIAIDLGGQLFLTEGAPTRPMAKAPKNTEKGGGKND